MYVGTHDGPVDDTGDDDADGGAQLEELVERTTPLGGRNLVGIHLQMPSTTQHAVPPKHTEQHPCLHKYPMAFKRTSESPAGVSGCLQT